MTKEITLSIPDEEYDEIVAFAELCETTPQEVLLGATMRWIEDQYDLAEALDALEEYHANPVTYSHAEVFGDVVE
jgi:hypothetical protein